MPLHYADSSALVKLVHEEPESQALRRYVADAELVSCELVLTEVPRAVRRAAQREPELPLDLMLERTRAVIEAVALRPLSAALLAGAGALAEPALRTLDAIHVAAAASLDAIDAFVTYDERQAAAARLAGLRTAAPAP